MTTAIAVPFLDLKAQYRSIKPEVDAAIMNVLEHAAFVAGPNVARFEEGFARLHHVPYCVGVNSGTSALHIVLMALDIGPGDEVIVPANTFFATAEAVSLTGARPVFVDCEETYYNLDPAQLEAAITPQTRAVIPVHLYGQPAEMAPIQAIAEKHRLHLVEDCAQAHLATYQGQSVGSFGVAGCFSFYPGKNLGAYGEAGAVVTRDEALYRKMMALREHGSSRKYYHHLVGHNYRMEGIQGAVLDVKLKYIADWTRRRQENAQWYRECLQAIPELILPAERADSTHVYHLYAVRVQRREELIQFLQAADIQTGIHYPVPCHLQEAYANLGHQAGDFPVAERCANSELSLPMFPELTREQIEYVSDAIRRFYQA